MPPPAPPITRIALDPAVTPAVWWYEVRNVLIVNERRGRLDRLTSSRALELLGSLPIVIDTDGEEEL